MNDFEILFNQTRFNKSIWFYNYKLKFLKLKVDNGYAKWNRKQPLIWLQRRMHSKWRWEKEDQKREKENQKDRRNKILNDSKWFNLCQVKHYIMLFVFKQKEILKKLKEQINESLNQLDDLIEELPARKEPYTVEKKEVLKKIKIEV